MKKIHFEIVVELPTKKTVLPRPTEDKSSNPEAWKNYSRQLIDLNYENVGMPFACGFHRLLELEDNDIIRLIKLHTENTKEEDFIPFFGGYALFIDGQPVLFPQCCATLYEYWDWVKILQPDFQPFYFTEGHPSPKISIHGKHHLIIECIDEYESFYPKTPTQIIINKNAIRRAFINVQKTLESFSKRINQINPFPEIEDLAQKLIWGWGDQYP